VPVTLAEPTNRESNPFGYIRYIDSSSIPDIRTSLDQQQQQQHQELQQQLQQHNLLIEEDDLITLVLPGGGEEAENECAMTEDEMVEYESDEMLFLLPKSLLQSPSLRSSSYWSAASCSAAASAQDDYTVSSLCLSQDDTEGAEAWSSSANRIEEEPTQLTGAAAVAYGSDGHIGQHAAGRWAHGQLPCPQPAADVTFERWAPGGWQSPCRGRLPRNNTNNNCRAFSSTGSGHHRSRLQEDPSHHLLLQHSVSVPALSSQVRTVPSESRGGQLAKFPGRTQKLVLSSSSDSDSDDPESPPSWISCFSSPRTKRKAAAAVKNGGSGPNSRQHSDQAARNYNNAAGGGPIRFIDETPSGSSADLVYGSPTLVDYENFSRRDLFAEKKTRQTSEMGKGGPRRRKSRSLSRPRGGISSSVQGQKGGTERGGDGAKSCDYLGLEVERIHLPERESRSIRPLARTGGTGTAWPQHPMTNGFSSSGRQITTRALVEQQQAAYPSPPFSSSHPGGSASFATAYYPDCGGRRCTCESRRSSDSGLADVSAHTDICPLSPLLGKGSLQSVTSLPNNSSSFGGFPGSSPRLSRRQFSTNRLASSPPAQSSTTIVALPPISSPASDFIMYNNSRSDQQREYSKDFISSPSEGFFSNHSEHQQPSSYNFPIRTVSADMLPSLPPPSLYRCSCGQEIPWGPSGPLEASRVLVAHRDLQERLLDSTTRGPRGRSVANQQKYSISMDDLATSGQGHHTTAVSLDQALSCSDIPTSTGFNLLPPPIARHSTQPSLLQQQDNSMPEASTTPVSLAKASWQRTKETYKSGLYAHWWLNASLQPIWEEPAAALLDHPAFDTETSL
jgi:hypothetical protein